MQLAGRLQKQYCTAPLKAAATSQNLTRIPQDTPHKLRSAAARALLRSSASVVDVDIAQIEARHASNREVSLLDSKGWLARLTTLLRNLTSAGQWPFPGDVHFGVIFRKRLSEEGEQRELARKPRNVVVLDSLYYLV